jgi:hypothetical protein
MQNGGVTLLETNLKEQISRFQGRTRHYWLRHYIFKMAAVVLSALITVCLGIKGVNSPYDSFLVNTALVLSAALTAVASWEGFANYRELWIQFTITGNRLRALQFRLDSWKADDYPEPEKKLRVFRQEYQKILVETNQAWAGVRKQAEKSTLKEQLKKGNDGLA